MTAVHHGNNLLRRCFTSTGKPKHRYLTKAEARDENKRNSTSLHAYHCDYCDGWHLGGGKAR